LIVRWNPAVSQLEKYVGQGESALEMSCKVVQGLLENATPCTIGEEEAKNWTKNRNRERILGNIRKLCTAFQVFEDPGSFMRYALNAMT